MILVSIPRADDFQRQRNEDVCYCYRKNKLIVIIQIYIQIYMQIYTKRYRKIQQNSW